MLVFQSNICSRQDICILSNLELGMPASLPGSSLLQFDQEEEGDADVVLHLEHGSPHPLLGLVCLSEIWQG